MVNLEVTFLQTPSALVPSYLQYISLQELGETPTLNSTTEFSVHTYLNVPGENYTIKLMGFT